MPEQREKQTLQKIVILTFTSSHTIFALEWNSRASLATFVSFEAAWIQTLAATSDNYYIVKFVCFYLHDTEVYLKWRCSQN